MKSIPVLLFHLPIVFGRISPKLNYDTAEAVRKVMHSRTHISRDTLDVPVNNEFGNESSNEEKHFWERILSQSFNYEREQCKIELDENIKCNLSYDPSISCQEYLESFLYGDSNQCELQVIFEYEIKNLGSEANKVTSIKTAINKSRPFTYISNSDQWSKTLNPSQSLIATQESLYDFCSIDNQEIQFEVGLECAKGNPNMFYPAIFFMDLMKDCGKGAKIGMSRKGTKGRKGGKGTKCKGTSHKGKGTSKGNSNKSKGTSKGKSNKGKGTSDTKKKSVKKKSEKEGESWNNHVKNKSKKGKGKHY